MKLPIMILEAILGWTFAVTLRLPLFLIGIPAVAIGLFFVENEQIPNSGPRPFTEHKAHKPNMWWHQGLPKVLWLWSNDRDGALGDKRGWWNKHAPFSGGCYSYWNKFWWLAIRNPVNNMRFTPFFAVDLANDQVELIAGQEHVDDDDDGSGLGWQFCVARGEVFKYYSFWYLSQPMPSWVTKIFPSLEEHVFQFRIGHKIKPRYNEQYVLPMSEDERSSAWKGFTFRVGFLDYKN